MSKRIILGLIAGTAVFGGVFGLAASLGITSNQISADEVAVSSCDTDGVHTAYTYDPQAGQNTHVVSDIDDACIGDKVTVRLFGADGGDQDTDPDLLTYGQQDVPDGDEDDNATNVDLNDDQDPEDIIQIEVVINGNATSAS
jgi:hypothetical protein